MKTKDTRNHTSQDEEDLPLIHWTSNRTGLLKKDLGNEENFNQSEGSKNLNLNTQKSKNTETSELNQYKINTSKKLYKRIRIRPVSEESDDNDEQTLSSSNREIPTNMNQRHHAPKESVQPLGGK